MPKDINLRQKEIFSNEIDVTQDEIIENNVHQSGQWVYEWFPFFRVCVFFGFVLHIKDIDYGIAFYMVYRFVSALLQRFEDRLSKVFDGDYNT